MTVAQLHPSTDHEHATSSVSGKIRVLVLAGGWSQHESSIEIASAIVEAAVSTPNLDISALVLTPAGRWLSEFESREALQLGRAHCRGKLPLETPITDGWDVVFPIIGENQRALKGLLELANIPYVGCGILTDALCNDKPMLKQVLGAHGIPLVGHVAFTRDSYYDDPYTVLRQIKKLNAPWFVKPANMGESVGISKVKEEKYLVKAIANAMRYSRRIIVEEAVQNAREFEIGILGNHKPRVSPVGEVSYDAEFYDHETKLTDETVQLHIPANIPTTLSKTLQETALEVYQLLDIVGYARIDFLFDPKTLQFYLNEVTTAPYLVSCSMFARLWEAGGLGYSRLLEELVELAIHHHHHCAIAAEHMDPTGP